jgi:high frequency lysogenization protein
MKNRELSQIEQQVLALAGIAQAARIVDQVAKSGSYPLEFLEASIHSLFEFEPDTTADIYGGTAGVKLGLQNLSALLASQQEPESREIVRYLFSILHLERKFAARHDMVEVVHSRLEHASFKADHFATNIDDICRNISGIYQDTLSHLRYRINVTGSAEHLHEERNANLVRALLLAGIRSAFLWRQLGGRRWKLPLQRRQLLRLSQELSRGLGVV